MFSKKELAIKILVYTFSLMLIIWYFSILFKGMNPKVSREYRMHYIEKSLSDWPGDNGLEYHFNTKLIFGNEYLKANTAKCRGIGWYRPDENAAWTKDKAIVYFNLIDEIKGEGTLDLVLKRAVPNANVNIEINGKKVTSIKLSEDRKEYSFSIPKEILEERFLCLTFHVDNVKSFESLGIEVEKDLRKFYLPKDEVGIYVESINLKQN